MLYLWKRVLVMIGVVIGTLLCVADEVPIDLFRGKMPAEMKASTWKTFGFGVDAAMTTAGEPASIKITSQVEYAGCNFVRKDGKGQDLSAYWADGALSFWINRTGTMDLGALQFCDNVVSINEVTNGASLLPKLDNDEASWQQVVIPLKYMARTPLTSFTGIRFRVGRKPAGAAYVAKLQIVPSYDPALAVKAPVIKPKKAAKRWFPLKETYGPISSEGQMLLTVQPGTLTGITALPVKDSRSVRGFFGRVVDGRVDSFGWEGNGARSIKKKRPVREWPNIYSGVDYRYNGGDGMHVRVEAPQGFDLLTVQGGYSGTLRVGNEAYAPPWSGRELAALEGKVGFRNLWFGERVAGERISLTEHKEGYLANVAAYRVEVSETGMAEPLEAWIMSDVVAAGKQLGPYISRLFAQDQLQQVGDVAVDGVVGMAGSYRHVALPLEPAEEGGDAFLDAVELQLAVADTDGPATLHVRVADPFNPRLELAALDVAIPGAGVYAFRLDVIDQVVPAETPVWVSFAVDRGSIAAGEGKSGIRLVAGAPESSLAEYLAYRKLIFKSYFAIMIEQRPWRNNAAVLSNKQKVLKMDSGGDAIWEMAEMIREMKRLAPEDQVVDIYYRQIFGESPTAIPPVALPEDGPAWATHIRANIGQLLGIASWWLDNRQTPNGEFGGAVNDDTCLLMQLQSLPMVDNGPEGERLRQAYALLAEHAEGRNMVKGLNTNRQDPLHAYEEGVNLYGTMPWLFYGDPVYIERCMESVASLQEITRVTEDGKRYFFQEERRVGRLPKGASTAWHYQDDSYFLMVHAALTLAWYNQHPEAIAFLRQVFDSYLSHMTPDQWPRRIYPADGKVTYQSGRPLSFKADSAFVYMYYVTGDEAYLKPFFYAFDKEIWGWSTHRSLFDVMQRYDLKAGYTVPEDIQAKLPHVNYLLTGDKEPIVKALAGRINSYAYNDYLYKDAELFVDRLFLNNTVFRAALGGFSQRNTMNNSSGVEWRGVSHQQYASFVTVNSRSHLNVLVYNFTDAPLTVTMHPWQLQHGTYTYTVGVDTDGDDVADEPTSQEVIVYRHKGLDVVLPPGQVTVVDLTLSEALEPITRRMDLAVISRELSVDGEAGTLTVPVHNIGTQVSDEFVLRVTNEAGETLVEQTGASLPPPLDLQASVSTMTVAIPAGAVAYAVEIDAGDTPEITRENNVAKLK